VSVLGRDNSGNVLMGKGLNDRASDAHSYPSRQHSSRVVKQAADADSAVVLPSDRLSAADFTAALIPDASPSDDSLTSPAPGYRTALSIDVLHPHRARDAKVQGWLRGLLDALQQLSAASETPCSSSSSASSAGGRPSSDDDPLADVGLPERFLAAMASLPAVPAPPASLDGLVRDEAAQHASRHTLVGADGAALAHPLRTPHTAAPAELALFLRAYQRLMRGPRGDMLAAMGALDKVSRNVGDIHNDMLQQHHRAFVYMRDQIRLADARGNGMLYDQIQGQENDREYSFRVARGAECIFHPEVRKEGIFASSLTSHALRSPVIDYNTKLALFGDAQRIVADASARGWNM
jgi:hypothetical protein